MTPSTSTTSRRSSRRLARRCKCAGFNVCCRELAGEGGRGGATVGGERCWLGCLAVTR